MSWEQAQCILSDSTVSRYNGRKITVYKYTFCSKSESTYNGFIVMTIHTHIIKILAKDNIFIFLSLLSVYHCAAQTN